MGRVSFPARHKARELAVQALYQWQLAGTSYNELTAQFYTDNDMRKIDKEYFEHMVVYIAKNAEKIDVVLSDALDRPIDQVDPVELTILRISFYEFDKCLDVPYRVVINEGVELCKVFGSVDGYKYINGILDRLAKTYRSEELARK